MQALALLGHQHAHAGAALVLEARLGECSWLQLERGMPWSLRV